MIDPTANEKECSDPLRGDLGENRCQGTSLTLENTKDGITRLVPRKHWYKVGPPIAALVLSSSLKRTFSVSRLNSISKNSGSFEPYVRRSAFLATSILPSLIRKYADSGKENEKTKRINGRMY